MTSLGFSLEQLLSAVGALSILWFCLKAARHFAHVLRTYLLSEVWKGVDLPSYGPWAVVTGATAGIGKAYAHELARRGLNVVLISRSMEKLRQVAAEIEEQHGQSTKVIQADFTQGSEIYEPIKAALQGLEIGILVNNVGQAINKQLYFLQPDNIDNYIHDIVHCNMLSTTKMTQIILPQMVARKKGIVINLSSGAGRHPLAFTTMYSATKAFDDFFSQALGMEYRSKGIIVQSVMPLFVESNLSTEVKKFFKIPAEAFVRQALNTVGLSSRTSGCLRHSIQYSILRLAFPVWLQCSPAVSHVVFFLWKHMRKSPGVLGEAASPQLNREQKGQNAETSWTKA